MQWGINLKHFPQCVIKLFNYNIQLFTINRAWVYAFMIKRKYFRLIQITPSVSFLLISPLLIPPPLLLSSSLGPPPISFLPLDYTLSSLSPILILQSDRLSLLLLPIPLPCLRSRAHSWFISWSFVWRTLTLALEPKLTLLCWKCA